MIFGFVVLLISWARAAGLAKCLFLNDESSMVKFLNGEPSIEMNNKLLRESNDKL